MFPSQIGKSECELNVLGYHVDYDPAPCLIIQPTLEDAQSYSKDRLQPMFSDSPSLVGKVSEPRGRDSSSTIMRKEFAGGFVALVGANSPSGLASRPIRILLIDEADRFPKEAGEEGDPISIAKKRTTTFWNSLVMIVSSPTNKGESRIEKAYLESTQEQWCVRCPSCGLMQAYDWGRLDFETTCMACCGCGVLHAEHEWKSQPAEWIARNPDHGTRGFHLNAMVSPWLSWPELIAEFLQAKADGPEFVKTFVNTRLAEVWDEAGETLDEGLLETRRHYYDCDVPEKALLLTAGVDVQDDRIEVEVVGWGRGSESWGIQYAVLLGDPHKDGVWKDLDEFLMRRWSRADGRLLPIDCACIDSGHATDQVYGFTRKRMERYVYAVKGRGGSGVPAVDKARKVGKSPTWLFKVGTDASKDLLMSRLKVEEEGAGYCHFPRESEMAEGGSRGYEEAYFKGLLAEKRVMRKSQGITYHRWIPKTVHARNEPLDCRVYASAALMIRNPDWDRWEAVRGGGGQESRSQGVTGRRRGVLSRGVGG